MNNLRNNEGLSATVAIADKNHAFSFSPSFISDGLNSVNNS